MNVPLIFPIRNLETVMRKTIISALAFFSLIACVQEEVVSVSETDAITFDNQFVDITTRAESFVKENLDAFNVWGYINTPAAPLFEGTEVVRNASGAWSYDGTRYWIPQQNYYFAVIAPANSDSWSLTTYDNMMDDYLASEYGPGILTFTNLDGSEDLIYAASHVVAAESGNNQPVSFHFRHLLSKVRFSFVNDMRNPDINIRISDITMKSPLIASIDLASETPEWASHDDNNVLCFDSSALMAYPGSTCSTEDLFVIPSVSSIPYEITFRIEAVTYGVSGTEDVLYSGVKKLSVSGDVLEMGTSYNLLATITPDILDEGTYTAGGYTLYNVDGGLVESNTGSTLFAEGYEALQTGELWTVSTKSSD